MESPRRVESAIARVQTSDEAVTWVTETSDDPVAARLSAMTAAESSTPGVKDVSIGLCREAMDLISFVHVSCADLYASEGLRALATRAGRAIFDAMSAASAFVLLRAKDDDLVSVRALTRPSDAMNESVGEGAVVHRELLERVKTTKRPALARVAGADWPHGPQSGAFMCAPCLTEGRLAGALYVSANDAALLAPDLEKLAAMARHVAPFYEHIRHTQLAAGMLKQTLLAFIESTEAGDPFTAGHTQRVRHYAVEVATRLALAQDSIRRVRRVAEFHSLCHGGDLTGTEEIPQAERAEADLQIPLGSLPASLQAAGLIPGMKDCLPALRSLAELLGGARGREAGQARKAPVEARIVLVCDAFDVLTSQRPFSPTVEFPNAIGELRASPCGRFDPKILDELQAVVEKAKV